MIKLLSIQITGFKDHDNNIMINFSDEPISILYGENGCGKTTILKIINAIFMQNEAFLLDEDITSITVTYKTNVQDNKQFVIDLINDPNLEDEDGLESNCYNWSEFINSELFETSSILFGVNRGISSVNLTPSFIKSAIMRSPRLKRYFNGIDSIYNFSNLFSQYFHRTLYHKSSLNYTNDFFDDKHVMIDEVPISSIEAIIIDRYNISKKILSDKVQNALFSTLSLFIKSDKINNQKDPFIPNNFDELIEENRANLIESLKNSSENKLKDDLIEMLYNKSPIDSSNSTLRTLLLKMIEEIQLEKANLNSINILINKFNKHLRDYKNLIVTSKEAYIELNNGVRHKLNKLSSGERHLLTFLTICIIEGSNKNFILIDEPEISLNISWQRRLMQLFKELVPNSQIIVASHSPSIVGKNTNYLVELEVTTNV